MQDDNLHADDDKSRNKSGELKIMRLVNDKNAESPFYVGNCKANTPPKHVVAEGVPTREVTINGTAATLYQSPKSPEYIYIKHGDQWLWVKDASLYTTDQAIFVNVPAAEPKAKEPKAPKEQKAPKAPKSGAEDIGLDLTAKYNMHGTVMTGAEAKKRFGVKNVKDSMASGKMFLCDDAGNAVTPEAPAEAETPAEQAPAPAAETTAEGAAEPAAA